MDNYRKLFLNYAQQGSINLDAASTTQLPDKVISAIDKYIHTMRVNPGRGGSEYVQKANETIHETRVYSKNLIVAQSHEDIFFVPSSSYASNLIAFCWGYFNLKDKDEILLSKTDHESTILPWVQLQSVMQDRGIEISLLYYDTHEHAGDPVIEDIIQKCGNKTRVLVLSHIHGIYGTATEFHRLKGQIPEHVRTVVDASHSIGRIDININDIGADFLFFSASKMFALDGLGVLYINSRNKKDVKPFFVASRGVKNSSDLDFIEIGSLNLTSISSLNAAINLLQEIGIDSIESYVSTLTQYLYKRLDKLSKIEFLPGIANCSTNCSKGYGIVSFALSGTSSKDVGDYLSDQGINVRYGNFCTTEQRFNNYIRVSLHINNTKEEIDRLINALADI
jgi:cysteine desulfurase / selenocysteine lyase